MTTTNNDNALDQRIDATIMRTYRTARRGFSLIELVAVLVILATIGVAAWMLTIYVGPIVSMRRSPTRGRSKLALVGVYALALLITFAVATDAHIAQDVVLDEPEPTWRIFLNQFLQPLTW